MLHIYCIVLRLAGTFCHLERFLRAAYFWWHLQLGIFPHAFCILNGCLWNGYRLLALSICALFQLTCTKTCSMATNTDINICIALFRLYF